MKNKFKTSRKIALIGPIYPYRGGIAQYNKELKDALENQAELTTYSFKRLYPSFLYPGKSDKEEGVKEWLQGVRYVLDAYSPFSLRRAARQIVADGNETVVITWWTLFWQPGLAYIARYVKRHGVKVVYLCHNIFGHDTNPIERAVAKKLLSVADAYVVHSSEEADRLKKLYPDKPVVNRILPIYNQFPNAKKHLAKRGRLEVLFFGFIRPYKGLNVLLKALSDVNDTSVYVTIAGESWIDAKEYEKKIQSMNIPNLELHLRYVDENEVAQFFDRADIVALPYLSATGSAVLALAYHYRKPVLASAVGGIPDGVIEGKTGWLVPPNSPDALAKALSTITRETAQKYAPEIERFCKDNSWDHMAKEIVTLADNLKKG